MFIIHVPTYVISRTIKKKITSLYRNLYGACCLYMATVSCLLAACTVTVAWNILSRMPLSVSNEAWVKKINTANTEKLDISLHCGQTVVVAHLKPDRCGLLTSG